MKVKLTTSISGASGAFGPGDEYECSEAEAERFIAAGYAVEISKTVERAVKKHPKKEARAK